VLEAIKRNWRINGITSESKIYLNIIAMYNKLLLENLPVAFKKT
jgi:hypothetical protein